MTRIRRISRPKALRRFSESLSYAAQRAERIVFDLTHGWHVSAAREARDAWKHALYLEAFARYHGVTIDARGDQS